ncbi:MAG: hypothetical protein HYY29_03625 [Chloroflexi bacterium]|nr:hypothetical protein [Chloroflexota bacterium]
MNTRHTIREINQALAWIAPEPSSPEWWAVQVLTQAIEELEERRQAEWLSGQAREEGEE